MPMPSPRIRTLIGLALAFTLGAPALTRADDDATKRRDKLPPVKAKAIKGRAIRPDEWKLADRALDAGGGVAGGFDAKNITLLSWLPLADLPGGNSTSAADCWGYTSPSGREYAIIGIERGTAFVEVTDPLNPVITGFVQGSTSLWHDVTVIGDYAYACSDSSGPGVQIIDLRQIDSGTVRFVKNWAPNGLSTIHTIISNPESKHLFLNGANIQNGGLICVDASDPENLVMKGAWTDQYMHESQAVTMHGGPYDGKEIVFGFTAGPYYGYAKGFTIIDTTDLANPTKLALVDYPNIQFCHQGWVTPDFKYLYINDELDDLNRTRVFDVSNPAAPVYKTYFTQATGSIDHNLYIKDGKIYEANYTSGLRIFDMADPLAPVEIAHFDTHPEGDGASYNGAWGNYPYFASGTIIISDLERGLFIVKEEVGQLSFAFPNGLPEVLNPGVAAPITTTITEDQITLDASTVRLNVSVNGGSFDALVMSSDGQGNFVASLPAADCYDDLDFYVSAAATDGRTFTSPSGAPESAHHATVYTSIDTLISDALETDTGWVSGAQGDNASTGMWNRANPIGTGAQPEDDHSASGVNCWVTDGRGGGLGDYDVDGGKTTLLTPVYDLSTSPEASIGYWRWYSNSTGNAPFSDTFRVDISADGGGNWKSVEVVGPGGDEVSGGWYYHQFRVADITAPTAKMKLRFIAEDAGDGSVVEAAVDDFEIIVVNCDRVTCSADLDGNGTLDLFDFLAFTNLFNAEDPGADWDTNGVFDLFDFLGYVNAFNEGC